MGQNGRPPQHVIALSNFNPMALISLVVLVISIIMACLAIGLDNWSSQKVRRGSDLLSAESSTTKTQGTYQRCVRYGFSSEQLNLPSDQLPSSKCIAVSSVNCSAELSYLPSGQEDIKLNELENVNNEADCEKVKTNLSTSFDLMILGIVVTVAAMIMDVPLWHRGIFLVSAVVSLLGALCYAVAIGLFFDTDRDYAGFFSLNGIEADGCLDYSFGMAVGSFILNLSGAIVSCLAVCYYYTKNKSKED